MRRGFSEWRVFRVERCRHLPESDFRLATAGTSARWALSGQVDVAGTSGEERFGYRLLRNLIAYSAPGWVSTAPCAELS